MNDLGYRLRCDLEAALGQVAPRLQVTGAHVAALAVRPGEAGRVNGAHVGDRQVLPLLIVAARSVLADRQNVAEALLRSWTPGAGEMLEAASVIARKLTRAL